MKRIISILISVLLICSVAVVGFADTSAVLTLSTESKKIQRNNEIEFVVKLQNCENIKSLALVLEYDADNVFVLQNGDWLLSNSVIANVDKTTTKCGTAVIAFSTATNPNGNIFRFCLKAKSNATIGSSSVKVTPIIKNGTETIKCNSSSVSVNVVIPVSGISLDKSAITVKPKNTASIAATIYPAEATNKSIVWVSSDNSVATVNNGLVYGVSNGSVIITAKTEDGSFTATCNVTVQCLHNNKTKVSATKSTCRVRGYDAYYKCNDCGQLFSYPEVDEISSIPFRAYASHTGGTATCTNRAVCSVCGVSYGNYGSHSYTAQAKKSQTLKTAGTCITEAVYYYSCSVCGACEKNDKHTFNGDKNINNHAGGTEIKYTIAPTCGSYGYSGDKYCVDCGVKLSSGSIVSATGKHTWNSGVVTKAATATSTGIKTYTCTVCKATKTETIAKLEVSSVANVTGGKTSSTTNNSVILLWNKVANATGYKIYTYNASTKKYSVYKTVTTNSASIGGLLAGTRYDFYVKAYAGTNSNYITSNGYHIIKVMTKPANISGLSYTATTSSVTLKWNKVAKVTGYKIYTYNASTKTYSVYKIVSTNSVTLTGLSAGSRYDFYVKAYRTSGSFTAASKDYQIIRIMTNPANVTGGKVSSVTSTSVTLKWNTVAKATGYKIYIYNVSTKKYSVYKTVTSNSVTITGLSAGSRYDYYIKAYRTNGALTTVSTDYQIIRVLTTPANVSGLSYTATTNSVTLKWNTVAKATGYKIYTYDSSTGKYNCIKTVTTNSATISGLNTKTGNTYCVKAYRALDSVIYLSSDYSLIFAKTK